MRRLFSKLKDSYSRKSIQFVITVSFVCLISLVIFVLGAISYFATSGVVKENSGDYVVQLVDQVNRNIQYYIDNVEVIKYNIYYDHDINKYLINKNTVDEENLQNYLNNFVTARADIANIFIFTEDGRYLANDADIELNPNFDPIKEEWYQKAIESEGLVVSTSRVQNIINGQYNWVISCSNALRDENNEVLGVLLIDLNFNFIEDMCSGIKLGNKGYVFVLDEEGDIVYHPKQQLIYSNLYNEPIVELLDYEDGNVILKESGEQKQYSISSIEGLGWKVIGAVYMDDLLAYTPTLQSYFVMSAIVALIIAVTLAILISRQILHPLKDLADAMKVIKKGDFTVQIPVEKGNEVAELSRTFNSMVIRIKNLIKKINQEEQLKRKNELKALQAQINPHFLYNTLDAIIWMAELKDYESVKLMTSSLAKLFRISISKGKQIIPVGQEVEHIKNYLKIQKMRYGNKLDYVLDLGEGVNDYYTVKLILQPIVENAIYHGIKYKEGTGMVRIAIYDQQDVLKLSVSDDGIGMTEDEITRVLNKTMEKKGSGSGVGMSNVDERIKLYFGDDFGITIKSELDEGTEVVITIPKISMEEGGQIQ
ncbi:cache domain-containing sensor histidine kinase [Vallitalea okinawensis]|uniref:cache domain-containing sensor histidine kinase n=1 Tax=Vallitalea okinawensis TaxID=2078660 RepID=UPI000CFBBE32|nr:sensor histidine kinase [Vallitalea okinawensis]